MKLSKLLLATIGATVLLGTLVGSASARNFSLVNTNTTFRTTFSALTFEGAFGRISCPLTLEGSLHARTIAKVAESLIGLITAGVFGACASGGLTILRETLPWHIRYRGFNGILPNITSIEANAIGVAFSVREPLFTCLATSTAARPMIITFNRDVPSKTLSSAVISGTVPTNCGAEGRFESNRGTVTLLGNTNRITVTLI